MNINCLNKTMLIREIENEFYNIDDNKISSLINIFEKDISNISSVVGISLFGSFKSIADEIYKNNGIKDLNYNKISKYINYIIWNIEYLDLHKVDNNLYQFNDMYINDKNVKFNFVTVILYLYFYSLTNDNTKLQKDMIFVFKSMIDNSLKISSEKFEIIIANLNDFFLLTNNETINYSLWEKCFVNLFDNTFKTFPLFKDVTSINKFNVEEVDLFYYSRIIKTIIISRIKRNISFIDPSLTTLNVNLAKIYKFRQDELKKLINDFRNEKDYFSSSILTYYLEILNED